MFSLFGGKVRKRVQNYKLKPEEKKKKRAKLKLGTIMSNSSKDKDYN